MSKGMKWYFWGTAVGALVAVVVVITVKGAWGIDDIVWMVVKGWFLLWMIIHLAVAIVWMTIHLFDDDGNGNHNSGGSSSSGVEWGRLANWYMRGRLRNQMRRASRW